MKNKTLSFLFFFILAIQAVFAQKFTVGIENGINFSNLHKTYDYDRFDAMPGPVNGIFAKYDLGNWLTLQSGINHASYYFSENIIYYYDYLTSSSYYNPDAITSYPSYSTLQTSRFGFLRIPLLIKYKTPGRVNFEIGGGSYLAFLTNDEFRGKDRDIYPEEYIDENFPKMHDWGWMLESSVNYNINNKWNVFAAARITYGHEKYYENVEGKMGSTEFTLGVGYKPFRDKENVPKSDSLGQRISVLPHSGIVISRLRTDRDGDKYNSSVGFASGVSLKYTIGTNLSLISGAWYERKGYNLDNHGYYTAFYHPVSDESAPLTSSNVQLDYMTIPLLLDIDFGKKVVSHINIGSYFSLMQNAFAEGVQLYQIEYDYGYRVTKQYFNDSHDQWFNNFDWGFLLAYRLDIPVFKWADAFVSVNQALGIKSILNENEEFRNQYTFLAKVKMYNTSTGINVGLSIPINKK